MTRVWTQSWFSDSQGEVAQPLCVKVNRVSSRDEKLIGRQIV